MWKEYFFPTSIEEASNLLDKNAGKARIIAGGTDLVLEIKRGLHPEVEYLVDVSHIPNLDQIILDENGFVHIGPLVTHNQCAISHVIRDHALLLAEACLQVGSPQIRNRGTIAGNLMTASPANDSIPPLIALNATLVFQSSRGKRQVPIEKFYLGVRKTRIEPGEILVDIVFKGLTIEQKSTFLKLGLRKAQAISVVDAAFIISLSGNIVSDAVIALGAVAPVIIRAPEAEDFLIGKSLEPEIISQASALAVSSAVPIDDVRSTASYRRRMVGTLTSRALKAISEGKEKDGLPDRMVTLSPGYRGIAKPSKDSLKSFNRDSFVEVVINGNLRKVAINNSMSLLDLVREEAGQTASKKGCDEGECGACTVLLDGSAVMGCLVPAACAHGATIETAEGLEKDAKLHPLQQAFMDSGAVQCGACTAGMMMSAAALLQEIPQPTRQQVKEGISGNLCRCTGYIKIIDAILSAAGASLDSEAAEAPEAKPVPESLIGVSKVRIDALTKVRGKAVYAADMTLPGMLYGYTLRSPYPHARIDAIDAAPALRIPGVVAVLTTNDIPGSKLFGNFVKDQQVLAEKETRFVGEAVALVALDNPLLAEEAINAIQVSYTVLPAITDMDQALDEESPLVHETGHKVRAALLRKGDIEYGFAHSDLIVEGVFKTQEIEHAYIETEAAFAVPGSNGISVYSCVQHPHYMRNELARVLSLSANQIRVIQTVTGGGFGGKIDVTLQHHAALLALKTNRPVRMVYSRDESIACSYKRMPYRIDSKIGVTSAGKLMAAKIEVIGDVGAYVSHGKALLTRGIVHCVGPYVVPNIEADGYMTFTHKVPNSAMRGYGTPAVLFAMEQQLNRISKKLGIDPFTVRYLNGLKAGAETATGQQLTDSVGLQETISAAGQRYGWNDPVTLTNVSGELS